MIVDWTIGVEVELLAPRGASRRTLAEHLPILHFVAPRITYAMSARVTGATPSVLQPGILWNAEVLSVSPEGPRASR